MILFGLLRRDFLKFGIFGETGSSHCTFGPRLDLFIREANRDCQRGFSCVGQPKQRYPK